MLMKLVLLLFILKGAFSLEEKNFTESSGVISPEKTHGRYLNNVHIKYNVRVPNGKIVKLSFKTFNVLGSMPKCEEDSVEIFIGCKGQSLGKFCSCGLNEMKLFDFYSKDNCISLVFKTDKQYHGSGFEAQYSSFDKSVSLSPETSCSKLNIHQKNVGNFFSPHWPNKYLKNFKCTWTATIPKGYNATIYFMSFLIEPSHLCAKKSLIDDYVTIEALTGSENKTIDQRICSKSGVDQVLSYNVYNASKVYVTFITDADAVLNQETGFAAGFLSYTTDTSFAECVKQNQVTDPPPTSQVTHATTSKSMRLTSTEPWAMLVMMLTVIVLLDIMQLQADANEI